MQKPTLIAVCLCLYAPFTLAQHPLDDFPFSVGGYVHSASGQPIENASVTFIDPITLEEFSGLTDANGWYGNLGYVGVSDVPQAGYLRGNYPNPFVHVTTIEIYSDGLKSNGSRYLEIFDIRGRLVGTVPVASGSHEIQTISKGSLPHGAYFYRLAGEVRKMVGSPRNVTVRLIGSEEKTLSSSVEHQVIVSADGFEQVDMLVELIEGEVNHLDFSLAAVQTPLDFTLAGDAWGLLDIPLYGGTVHLRNASGEEFSAPVDSSWSLDFSVVSFDEQVEMWFEHPEMSASGVLFPQGLPLTKYRVGAARNFGPDDDERITFTADNPNLALAPESLRYKGVDNEWADNSIWRALLHTIHATRGHHREHKDGSLYIEVLTTQRNFTQGEWLGPASEADIANMSFVANYRASIMSGGQPDGTVYYDTVVSVVEFPTGPFFDKQYLAVDPSQGPGNWPYTEDGYLEIHFATTPPGTWIGTVAEEAHNEMLTDYNGSLGIAINQDGTLNNLGLAATNTYLSFPHHTNFNGNQW